MKRLIFALVEAPNVILSGTDADRINHKPVGSIQISLHRRDVLGTIDRGCAYVCVCVCKCTHSSNSSADTTVLRVIPVVRSEPVRRPV